jgi:23S rRNA pseudouridine2605 synthase
MKERIQKILSARGVASRRKAEEMIQAGRVSCNGITCILGDTADADVDTITVDGAPIAQPQAHVYIMLHKPRGFVTTLSDEKGRKNAAQLVADCGKRVYPVGRLDMDSEGLLLFTNDGAFANELMHPKHEVNKTYRVTVLEYSPEALEKLKQPITLDGYTIRKPDVTLESCQGKKAQILVTIHEGRNRQVRRMCAAAGMTVMRLVRIREGDLTLGDLPKGKWRYLTNEEIAKLK